MPNYAKIPTLEIIQNAAFNAFFRIIVSCYGTYPHTIVFDMLVRRLLSTIDKKAEILSILESNGWNDGFQMIHFKNNP